MKLRGVLSSSRDPGGVGPQFKRYPTKCVLEHVNQLVYDLDVHADMRPVIVHPWLQ
jgi:hypothetical protein